MNVSRLPLIIPVLLLGSLGCSGPSTNDAGTGGGDATGGGAVGTGGGTNSGGGSTTGGGTATGGGTTGSAECDLPANAAKRAALLAAQPTIGTRSRTSVTHETSFASLADAGVSCPVTLKFKDSNGNGTIEAYEDWSLAADARAADLLGRMSADDKLALFAHLVTTDAPTTASDGGTPSAAVQMAIASGIRFGLTAANTSALPARATWANNLQAACEASALGIPFVLSSDPAHSVGNGRVKAKGFSQWPQEPGIAATGELTLMESFGKVVAKEYRAIGISLALSPSADLATEPRWFNNQFTFGEDSASVAAMVGAYLKGLQGSSWSGASVAGVVSHFPGAGPAQSGWDARLAKGKFVVYPGGAADAHLAAFQKAFDNDVAGVMPGYGISQTGPWTALGGLLNGSTLEQVGASFNKTLLTDVLRTHYGFGGLVVAPLGVLEDASVSPLGAPWGVESSTKPQRLGKAVSAGVDNFVGLNDTTALAAAKTAGLITDAQINASARRALTLMFKLGLFENPYVDPAQAPLICNSDESFHLGLDAMDRGMVLVVNNDKPAGWLNGTGDGTQSGDKGNAGNGNGKVLPAPPGEPYVSAGCRFYMAGNVDLDYVRSVSAGYGELTNDELIINNQPVSTEADKMAASDYVFIRITAPSTQDPDSGPLKYCKASLEYTSAENAAVNAATLQPIIDARAAIASHPGSKTQIIVGVQSGRPAVLSEVLSSGVSAVYVDWSVTDKVFLDVAFGITSGRGKLPMGLPKSDADSATQKEDVAGDGQNASFLKGVGFQTNAF